MKHSAHTIPLYLVVGMGSCMDVLQEGSREKKKLALFEFS